MWAYFPEPGVEEGDKYALDKPGDPESHSLLTGSGCSKAGLGHERGTLNSATPTFSVHFLTLKQTPQKPVMLLYESTQ